MQARYYDPVIGRFYSNDPVGFKNVYNFNRYAYANNNPYKYVDPDGQDASLAAKDPLFTDPSDVQPIPQEVSVQQLAINNAIGLVASMAGGTRISGMKLKTPGIQISPGIVQSRINVSNKGFVHTMQNHLNPSKSMSKSQFTISAGELKNTLQSADVVKSPVRQLESGNFARTITSDKVVGNVAGKFGG